MPSLTCTATSWCPRTASATHDVHGNIMVSEDRIRYAYESGAGDPSAVYHELSLALGEAWDEELEPFRHAAEGAPVRWLHQVG